MKRMWSKNELKATVQVTQKGISTLVDSQGRERFIEGDIEIEEITGLSKNYGKWSLSGSHLLIVLSIQIEDATAFTSSKIANVNLPDWIREKIIPIAGNNVVYGNITLYNSDGTSSQTMQVALKKGTPDGDIYIYAYSLTLTATRNGRIQYDLLIDAD